MTPIEFGGVNARYAENQPEYLTLPTKIHDDGVATSCWKGSFMDRLRFLFTGKLWLHQMTFFAPLQPILPETRRSV